MKQENSESQTIWKFRMLYDVILIFNAKDSSHFFLYIVSLVRYISMKISHEVALCYTYYLNE